MKFSAAVNSVGHALASFYKKSLAELPKVEKAIDNVEAHKGDIDAVVAAGATVVEPGSAPVAVAVTDAGLAVLGEVNSLLVAYGKAAEDKLLNAGFDINVLNIAKGIISTFPDAHKLAATIAAPR